MSHLPRRARSLLLVVIGLLAVCASGCEGVELYDVTRTSILDCDIRPNGEFCGDLAPPHEQVFAVERRDTHTLLYFDEETWIAEGIDGERSVVKVDQSTRDPGPCTNTLRRELKFSENGEELSGTLEISTRTEGPEACGETPRGDRRVFSLTGFRTSSI